MKKICTVLAFVLCCGIVFAQEKSVTILNFVNATGDETNAAITKTTQGILVLSVRYLGKFKLLETPKFGVTLDPQSLKGFAEATKSEYLVFGTIDRNADGGILLNGKVYDRSTDSVFSARETAETAETALDVFSASDNLSLSLLSKLCNEKVQFGTIAISVTAGTGKYDVFINNVPAGSNVSEVRNVPDGFRTVTVVGRSGPENGKTLFSDNIMIEADKARKITIAFTPIPEASPRLRRPSPPKPKPLPPQSPLTTKPRLRPRSRSPAIS